MPNLPLKILAHRHGFFSNDLKETMSLKNTVNKRKLANAKKKNEAPALEDHQTDDNYDEQDWHYEDEDQDYDADRPSVHENHLEPDEETPEDLLSDEHFHKLKSSRAKKHPRIEEHALKDVEYHSKAGKNSRLTGSNVRRKKSQF